MLSVPVIVYLPHCVIHNLHAPQQFYTPHTIYLPDWNPIPMHYNLTEFLNYAIMRPLLSRFIQAFIIANSIKGHKSIHRPVQCLNPPEYMHGQLYAAHKRTKDPMHCTAIL